jgi:1-acyl-sn-glycerol-3-phosphate acyltransferase
MPRSSTNAASFVWGVIATLLAVVYTAVTAPFAAIAVLASWPRVLTRLARIWSRLIVFTCGVRVKFEGLENLAGLKSCVLVANHQSFFDVFAMLAYFPIEVLFVAKKELLKIPAFGFVLSRSQHIVIDPDKGGRSIRRAVDALRRGFIVTIFPEGERFNDGRVHPFDDGAAWLAILGHKPVVPMAINGSGRIYPRKQLIVSPGGEIRFTIGKPIATDGMHSEDRIELTRRLENEVRANVAT